MTVTVRSAPKLLADMLLDAGVRLPEPAPLPDETLPTAHAPSPATRVRSESSCRPEISSTSHWDGRR